MNPLPALNCQVLMVDHGSLKTCWAIHIKTGTFRNFAIIFI